MGVVGYCLLLALKRYQHVAQSQSTSHRLHSAFLPPPPLPLFLCFFTAALIADIHSLLFCFNSVHFFVVFFCFSSLKVQFSRSARILFVFSKPLESAFIMHLTLSSTAVSPPPPPALLLLFPFQFATAALPFLFCTLSLSSALHTHSPTAAAAITICSLPFVCPSHSCCNFHIACHHIQIPISIPSSSGDIIASIRRMQSACKYASRGGGEKRNGGRGETENEAQTSQISPAVAKQFNHIAQKFEVSYKNKIHTNTRTCLPLRVCACVARSLFLSLEFVLY